MAVIKAVSQISYGSGDHLLVKDSQNRIYVTGNNLRGALCTGDDKPLHIPKQINSKYFAIWGDIKLSQAKSARK